MAGLDQIADDVGHWFATTFAGATGTELELDRTDSPDALILGDPAALAVTAAHLRRMGAAFERTALGLRQIDVGRWTGAAADAFHATFQNSPKGWIDAADAFGRAADVVEGFRATVVWAKDRSAQAIALHRQGQAASEQARRAYNAAAAVPPGPFVDPGLATIDRARQLLSDTRAQRDAAGADAARALAAATASAPPPPSGWDRLVEEGGDAIGARFPEFGHLVGGVGEGVEGLAKFARTLNFNDPYNATHPAQYVDGLSSTAAGLVHSALHPVTIVKDVLGTGWGSDPSRALGRLIPNLVLAVTTAGSGTANAAGERAALSASERAALESGERAAAENAGGQAALGATEPPTLAAADAQVAQDLARHEAPVGDIEGRLDALTVRDTGAAAVAPAEAPAPAMGTRPPALSDTSTADGRGVAPSPGSGVLPGDPGILPPLAPRSAVEPPLKRPQPFPLEREVGIHYRGEHDITDPHRWNKPHLVHVMSPAELEAHRLFVRDGKLYSAGTGLPFDTSRAATLHTAGDGQAMFVMDKNGNLYASTRQEQFVLHHSSFFGGKPVSAAGEISVRDGVPIEVTRRSGHYLPDEAHLDQVSLMFEEQGVDMTRGEFKSDW